MPYSFLQISVLLKQRTDSDYISELKKNMKLHKLHFQAHIKAPTMNKIFIPVKSKFI